MRATRHVSPDVVPGAAIAAPCLSWFIALELLHGSGGGLTYVSLFVGLPFVVTFAAAILARARARALPAASLSAATGLISWIVVAAHFAKFAN